MTYPTSAGSQYRRGCSRALERPRAREMIRGAAPWERQRDQRATRYHQAPVCCVPSSLLRATGHRLHTRTPRMVLHGSTPRQRRHNRHHHHWRQSPPSRYHHDHRPHTFAPPPSTTTPRLCRRHHGPSTSRPPQRGIIPAFGRPPWSL